MGSVIVGSAKFIQKAIRLRKVLGKVFKAKFIIINGYWQYIIIIKV